MDDVFDFGNLAAEEVEEGPESGGGKRRKYEVNPFLDWVAASWETGNGKQVVLPPKAVKDALRLIRIAAEDLSQNMGQEVGTRVRLYNKGQRINQSEVDSLAPQAKVAVKFWAAEKKQYAPRASAQTPEPADE